MTTKGPTTTLTPKENDNALRAAKDYADNAPGSHWQDLTPLTTMLNAFIAGYRQGHKAGNQADHFVLHHEVTIEIPDPEPNDAHIAGELVVSVSNDRIDVSLYRRNTVTDSLLLMGTLFYNWRAI